MIDVLVASHPSRQMLPKGLGHLGEHRLLTDHGDGWAEAANRLLDRSERDVLFVDDDVTILPELRRSFEDHKHLAEVFGPVVLFEGGGLQSAGYLAEPEGFLTPLDPQLVNQARHVAHVTASCMFIKREVVVAGVRFPVWPGVHSEDVAFTYEAWMQNFKVVRLPTAVIHWSGPKGGGEHKSAIPDLDARRMVNFDLLMGWVRGRGVLDAIRDGRIPSSPAKQVAHARCC